MRHDDFSQKEPVDCDGKSSAKISFVIIASFLFSLLLLRTGSVVEFNHGDPLGGSSSDHHHLPAGPTSAPSRPYRYHELASQPSIGFGGDRGILFFSNVVSIFRRNFSSINGIDVGIPDGRSRCHGVGGDVGGDVSVLLHLYCPDRGT